MPTEGLSPALKKALREANARWQEEASNARQGGAFERLDDGDYIARLTSGELGQSKSSRLLQVTLGFTVLEGECAGEKINKFCGLEGSDEEQTAMKMQYFAGDLQYFGLDPTDVHLNATKEKDPNFVVNVLHALVKEGPVVKLQLVTRGDFQAVNIVELLDDYEDETEEEEAPAKSSKKGTTATKPADKPPTKPAVKGKKPEPEEEEEEEEEEEAEEEEVDLKVGMKVSFPWKGDQLEGVVKELVGETSCKVKVGKIIYPVKVEKLELIDGETDD